MFKFLAMLALISITSRADAAIYAPTSKGEFCEVRKDLNEVKKMTSTPENLMMFRNQGGIGNGGVCWWHSRFQRNALYLTSYNPEAPFDSQKNIIEKIKKIRAGNQVVVINGYKSFAEFSYDQSALIQRELERWQKADGIKKFRWVSGLKGRPRVTPEKMKELMDELYQDVVVNGNIMYQKLQVPGITAHAWLVIDMIKTPWGYNLVVLDSNLPTETMGYAYVEGDTNFTHFVYGDFTPYTDHRNELDTIKAVINEYCK